MEPVRFSHLKAMSRSPAHYRHTVDVGWEGSAATRLGSAVHAVVFGQPYAEWTGPARRGKAWQEFASEHSGRLIVTPAELEQAQAMVASLGRHQEAIRLLGDGIVEQRIEWRLLGRACAGTPDVLLPGRRVVDLKTTRNAEPQAFIRDAIRRAYHAQVSWYQDGAELSGLERPEEAYIVAVESAAPYPVTVLRLTPGALDQGQRLCRLWMERLLQCERAQAWPGYCEGVVDFDVDAPFELEFGGDEEEAA